MRLRSVRGHIVSGIAGGIINGRNLLGKIRATHGPLVLTS